jgi:Rod binding domain-containing protein
MKTLATLALLILVVSMVFGGMTSNVSAQDVPAILKIAKRAQEQIRNQISDDSPDKVKKLFEEGTQKVNALEKALANDDLDSAKEYFLSAMKIFTEISRQSTPPNTPQTETTMRSDARDPSSDLQRLQVYVISLKTIAKKYNASIDFSELDELFNKARQEISEHQFALALETLTKIKEKIVDLNKELREEASKQESQRAKEYAQQYLEQLDRLIENAKKQGVADEIIAQLESAKENLSLADDKNEIIEQIRKIISIKDQFELTKNDRLESRVLQLEKTISRLSQLDGVNLDDLKDTRSTIQIIKRHLYNGEFEIANDLLRDLAKQLEEIRNSL